MKKIIFIGCLFSTSLFAGDMSFVSGGILQPFFRDDKENENKSKKIDDFWIDKLPVTNANYHDFIKANPQWQKAKVQEIFADKNYLAHWSNDQSPVVNISWYAAQAYCQWKGKRLPLTEEWEVAAQASETQKDASRDSMFLQKILNWYSEPSEPALRSVGKGGKNIYNISDLHGLVWEWVYDFNSLMLGEDQKFVCGGGSYNSKDNRDYAAFMRYGFRSSLKANYTVSNLGFRCAKASNELSTLVGEQVANWPGQSLYNLPIDFQDQDGTTFRLKNRQAPVQIFSMIYTNCATVCPMTVQILKKLAAKFNDPKKVQFVLVSFDSNKDTSEVLKSFALKHNFNSEQFTLLHGTPESIRTLAASLSLNYKEILKGDISHSNNISLLDQSGVLRFQEKSGNSQDVLTDEIRKILK